MNVTSDWKNTLKTIHGIALQAAREILKYYQVAIDELGIQKKEDNTPVTDADLAADNIIARELQVAFPEIPILSEEHATEIPYETRRHWQRLWLVDPLDGTKGFIKRQGDFTVNIALIEDHCVIGGVIVAPTENLSFVAWRDQGSYQIINDEWQRLHGRNGDLNALIAWGGRSQSLARVQQRLSKATVLEIKPLNSSWKFCKLAQGDGDVYMRNAVTSEWDTAAGQVILEEAGGAVLNWAGKPLRYNTQTTLVNPSFIALADRQLAESLTPIVSA